MRLVKSTRGHPTSPLSPSRRESPHWRCDCTPRQVTGVRPGSDPGLRSAAREQYADSATLTAPSRMQPDSTIEEVSMMSQMWKTGTLVAIALTATVAAQQPPPAAQQPPTAPPASRADSSDK